MEPDTGWESPTQPAFDDPVTGDPCRNTAIMFGMEKLDNNIMRQSYLYHREFNLLLQPNFSIHIEQLTVVEEHASFTVRAPYEAISFFQRHYVSLPANHSTTDTIGPLINKVL